MMLQRQKSRGTILIRMRGIVFSVPMVNYLIGIGTIVFMYFTMLHMMI